MNAVVPMSQRAVEMYGERSLTAADVQAQVNLIQDVMRNVMIDGTHYGKIPGTNQKSLLKPGAEKIMATFRLAADPEVEDLSAHGEIHYRVKVRILSASGSFLGSGIGECSSSEDKYSWRAPVCDREYELAPENRRRIKFAKNYGKVEERKQVRTNPADVGNTILKMAKKRALVDGVLTATAASDIFTQDIEDLPDEVAAEVVETAKARAHAETMARPENRGTPTAGVWESMTAEVQARMLDQASVITDMIVAGDAEGALDLVDTYGYSGEERVAFFTRLKPEDRGALRKVRDKRVAAAAKDAAHEH